MQARTDDISLWAKSSKHPCSALLLPQWDVHLWGHLWAWPVLVLSHSTVRSQLPWNLLGPEMTWSLLDCLRAEKEEQLSLLPCCTSSAWIWVIVLVSSSHPCLNDSDTEGKEPWGWLKARVWVAPRTVTSCRNQFINTAVSHLFILLLL